MNSLIRNLEKFITANKNYNLKNFIPKFNNELNKYLTNKNNVEHILYGTKRYDIIGINLDKNTTLTIKENYEHGYIYKIVDGKVKEEIFKDDTKIDEKILNSGDISYIDNEFKYKITTLEDITKTIHIYSPPKEHISL